MRHSAWSKAAEKTWLLREIVRAIVRMVWRVNCVANALRETRPACSHGADKMLAATTLPSWDATSTEEGRGVVQQFNPRADEWVDIIIILHAVQYVEHGICVHGHVSG